VNANIERPLRVMRKAKGETRRYWSIMSFYERFEHVVALLLTALIAVVIVIALWRLFGHIMTLLIAMEFKHSILRVIARKERIIQVKTVLLIALLALARKFIILDISVLSASLIVALALSTFALGTVYWLLRERDDRLAVSHH